MVEELKDLNRILHTNTRIKEITDAKPILLAQIRHRQQEKEDTKSQEIGLNKHDIALLKEKYGYATSKNISQTVISSPTNIGKFMRKDESPKFSPMRKIANRTIYNGSALKSEKNRSSNNRRTASVIINYPNTPGISHNNSAKHKKSPNISVFSAYHSVNMRTPMRHTVYSPTKNMSNNNKDYYSRAMTCPGQRKHRPNKIMKKMINFDKVMSIIDSDQKLMEGRKTKETSKTILLEEYRLERMKRTEKLLSEIDTTVPDIIKPWYNYKLRSHLTFEEEGYQIREHLHEMLRDPRRPVAKIERQKRARKKLVNLHRRSKIRPF